MQDDQIRHGNIYEEGMFLGGQPHHCICTNVSCSLSAIAEFLVYTNNTYAAVKVHQNALYSYLVRDTPSTDPAPSETETRSGPYLPFNMHHNAALM